MQNRITLGAIAVMALAVSNVMADEPVKSGLPVGKRVSAFHPLNVTGSAAGRKKCLV